MMGFLSLARPPWYTGIQVSEALELLLVLALFVGVLALVYFVQHWLEPDR